MTSSETVENVTVISTESGFPDGNCSMIGDRPPLPCSSEQDWYNVTSCECLAFPREELAFFDPPGIAFFTVAVFSAILDLGVVIVFIQFRQTPIVKASNRELSFLLLFVLICCFLFPVLQVGPVEAWRCVAANVQGPVTTCVNAIFLVKTHRVLSIFEARLPKVVHRQWILGRSLQVVGVFLLTLVQLIISVVYMGIFPPAVEYSHNLVRGVTYAQCKSEGPISIVNSAYPMLLTVLCLCFAFRARRLPENYGESRHILATMAISLTLYFTCFGISFVVKGTTRIIVLNISLSFTPLMQLVLLFLPKVYIILVCPERNTVQELRRMTLAHMQRQSEFSPTELGGRNGESKRQSQAEGRVKSRRSLMSKIHGVPSGLEASQNGMTARAAADARKKSVRIRENGTREFTNVLQRDSGDLHRGSTRNEGTVPEVNNTSTASDEIGDPGLPHKHQFKDSMRRQSSGLFVIQFLEKVTEDQSEDSAIKTLGDCPVKFSLRETDSEGEGEGDMFVVSMLGKTLTLTVEDCKTGVPEMLGGVYVGSKTVPNPGGTTKASNKQNRSPHTNSEDTDDAKELKEGSRNVDSIVKTQDCSDRGKVTEVPSQNNVGMENNNDEEPVLNVKSVFIHNCDIDTKCHTEAPNKTRENETLEFAMEGVFQEDGSISNNILHLERTDKNRLESDVEKVALVSVDEISPTSCHNKESTDHATVLMESEEPGEYRALSPMRNSKTPVSEDAVSDGSSSASYSTCGENGAEDKRRLLGERSRDLVQKSAKRVSPDESSPVDMSDICVQMSQL